MVEDDYVKMHACALGVVEMILMMLVRGYVKICNMVGITERRYVWKLDGGSG